MKGLPLAGSKNRLRLIFSLCDYKRLVPIRSLVEQTSRSKCTNPLDRIYALYSLLPENEKGLAIDPDYTKSTAEVYMETVIRSINLTQSLQILTTIELRNEGMNGPSWVPDWAVTGGPRRLSGYNTSLYSKSLHHHKDDKLHVTGRSLDSIESIQKFQFSYTSGDERDPVQGVRRMAQFFGIQHTAKNDDKILIDFCLTICGDGVIERWPMQQSYLTRQQSAKSLRHVLDPETSGEEESLSPNDKFFLLAVLFHSQGRSCYRTRKGYFGLAPASACPGDGVVVMLGLKATMVLRPVPEISKH